MGLNKKHIDKSPHYDDRIFFPHTYLTFGKYKDRRLWDVLRTDPRYIQWCLNNITWFKLDKISMGVYKKAIQKLPSKHKWETDDPVEADAWDGVYHDLHY